MKRISSDKYTVAWFKLSEVIARGEKERALGMYRLLAHSLNNSAFAKQLEGDILFFFNDNAAHDKYNEAVTLHINCGRYAQATMIYEHLLCIGAELSVKQFKDLISWHSRLKQQDKAQYYAELLITDLTQKKDWQEIEQLLILLDSLNVSDSWLCTIKQRIVENVVQAQVDADTALCFITGFVNTLIAANNAHTLHQLLTYLRTTNTHYYEKACEHISAEEKEFMNSYKE